jgi:ubiquinone/menaquinone biosynthesis C-methylase UbiE
MDHLTIEAYNLMAKEYDDETIDFWDRFPRTFLDRFAEGVMNGGKVLDIGSGPGRDGLLLQERGLTVTCLDASQAMVRFCLDRGLAAVEADFTHLPFENDSFDGAWAFTSLLHIKKSEITEPMQEIVRVLKPGGILGISLIEGETELYRESSGMKRPRWFSFYKKQEIEKLFTRFGFEIFYFDTFQPSSKNYLNFLASLLPPRYN